MRRRIEGRKNIRRQIEQRTNIPEDYKVRIEQIEKLIKDLKESVESLLITCQTLVENLQYLIGLLNRIITRQARGGNIIGEGGSLNPEIFLDDLEGGESLESYLNEVFGIKEVRNITLEDIKKRIEEVLGIEKKVDEIIKLINELKEKKQYFQSLDKAQRKPLQPRLNVVQREINRIKSDSELLQLPRTFRDLESKIKSSKIKPTFDNFSKLVSGLNNYPNLSPYRDFFVQLEGEIRRWLENIRGFIENISRKINDLIQNLEEIQKQIE